MSAVSFLGARHIPELHPDAQAVVARRLPGAARSVLYPLLAMLVAAVTWSGFAKVDRIVVARGHLLTTEPTIVVQPFERATIRKIEVQQGSRVVRGQPLVTLDPTFTEATATELGYRLALLTAEVERLTSEHDDTPLMDRGDPTRAAQAQLSARRRAEFQARLAEFDAGLRRLEVKRAGFTSVQDTITARLEIARELEATRQQLLLRDAGTRLSALQARTERLVLDEQLSNAKLEAADHAVQIQKLRAERDVYAQGWRREILQRLVDARRELETVTQELAGARRRGEMNVLRAPTDGVVLEIATRSVGSVVEPAETLVRVVPTSADIEAEIEVGPSDIGHVRGNAFARVKLDALPFQHHGTLTGTVRVISHDALASGLAGTGGDRRVYRGRVSLDAPSLQDVPSGFRLLPGMQVTAELKVGTRSVLSYFLHPIIRIFDESLHEP